MPKVLADITPLKTSRDFRVLFTGGLISFLGSQLTLVAVPVQVFQLTNSSLQVGLVSLGQMVPLIIGSLVGGTLADAFDRRVLLIYTQILLAATSAALALNAMAPHPKVWPLYVITAIAAAISGVDYPARNASLPAMVTREELPAALALRQIQYQAGGVVGPALAGLLLAAVGASAVYWIDTATFGAALIAAMMIHPLIPEGGGRKAGLASIAEGLRFLRRTRLIASTMLIDIVAMVFGMPRALFPAIGIDHFHAGSGTVGLLFAAPGAGALIAAVLTGWVGRVHRHGRAVLLAVIVWGLGIAAFGAVPWLWAALALLAIAGAADVVSAVFRNTILQSEVPDALRGRLSAVHIAVVTGGPRLGDLESGAVAAVTNPQFSVVSGGLLCIVGAVAVAWRYPELDRYDSRVHTRSAVVRGQTPVVGNS